MHDTTVTVDNSVELVDIYGFLAKKRQGYQYLRFEKNVDLRNFPGNGTWLEQFSVLLKHSGANQSKRIAKNTEKWYAILMKKGAYGKGRARRCMLECRDWLSGELA